MTHLVRKWITFTALGAVLATTLAACGVYSQRAVPVASTSGGSATFALPPGRHPTYIFPFESFANFSVQNASYFDYLMYRPLYWFGKGSTPDVNYSLSVADAPLWTNNDRTVTVHLKSYRWSDGTMLTPENVAFWMGMEWSEKNNWGGYTPGYFPDDLSSIVYSDTQDTVTFNIKTAVNQQWFLYNELAQITPMPLAWDETGFGHPSSCASEVLSTELADCPAVWSFLTTQSNDLTTYASSPIWRVVDGPWKLTAFSLQGPMVFAPNKSYSGPVKPHLSKVTFLPFTSDAAEYDALSSGELTIGYLPQNDVTDKAKEAALNPVRSKYSLVTVGNWAVNFININFNNTTVGPMLRQLYIRQALEHLVNQVEDVRDAYKGYGQPTYGPVPVVPATNLVSSQEKHGVYNFSVSAARNELTSHGWKIPSSGPAKCVDPGTDLKQCGLGVPRGAELSFNLTYGAGEVAASEIIESYKSTAAHAGIVINLQSAPVNTVISDEAECTAGQADCKWQMLWTDNGWTWIQPYYPSGELLLDSHSAADVDSYDSPTMDTLITKSLSTNSLAELYAYENYAAKQLPVIWFPQTVWSIEEVARGLRGVTPAWPVINLTPENWYYAK
jgi:peptide/nickel transport system substrate-binding protein